MRLDFTIKDGHHAQFFEACNRLREARMRGSEEQQRIIEWGGRTFETIVCKVCGETERLTYGTHNERLKSERLCFTCEFWLRYVWNDPTEPRALVINGGHFMIGDEERRHPGEMRGFAGRKFLIEKFTGEQIVTTNLWYQGKIPQHFRERLPDNARFKKWRDE